MVTQSIKSNDDTASNRCPAGSHLRASAADLPNLNDNAAPNTAFKRFLATDMTQSAETGNTQHGHLTDLAYAAEHARIEARKNHKRFTDAIYARRRRLREKEDERELVREAEHAQQVNKKLREENNELESMLSSATAEIEAMGDTEKEWLRGVLEKAKTSVKPTSKVTYESNGTTKSSSMKRKSRHIESTSKSTVASTEAVSILHSPNARSDNGSTQIENTAPTLSPSRPLHATTDPIEATSVTINHRRDGNDSPHRTGDRSIEALRQASYLQGLKDAVLLNQRRDILAATQNHQQQTQSQPPTPVAASASTQADILQSALLNDPIHQRTIDQLLLMNRINAMTGFPDSSALRPELSSLLDPSNLLRGGYNPAADLLSRTASMLGYPTDPSILALAGLRNFSVPPITSPTIPPPLTAAQILALSNSTNSYQLQMQLGLLNAYNDRTNVLTSLLQHHQQQEQQISLLTQLHQHEQQQPPPPPNSSSSTSLPPGDPPRSNFPPSSPFG